MKNHNFDILIIGGGHAGVEAAYIASQFSSLSIGILSLPGVGLASAPCNPSVGGVGKGQVVRELDALGGLMPKLADKSGIQFRILNESKGFAVQSTRVQIDKSLYSRFAEVEISKLPNVTVMYEKVLKIEKHELFEVRTDCSTWNSKKLIVTVGTFLNGKLHVGEEQTEGGRHNCESSNDLSMIFSKVKTAPKRFKTGTPPRLLKNSIDYDVLEEQPSDPRVRNFHSLNKPFERNLPQVSCYLARTNSKTMEVIKKNMEKSPMFNGQIKAVGARYCPSIEDKANRYPDKDAHHVFIEPEGLDEKTVYPSGISSSLPREIQEEMVQSIPGLEQAKVAIHGYAVEYDVVDTTELNYGLEYEEIPGLYFAGQVNGTSGYEEAAGQGFIAGVNSALSALGKPPLKLDRNVSYIGVMIEDLISNLRDEPYRLFTARSENRLFIREDNAVLRLGNERRRLGLAKDVDFYNEAFEAHYHAIKQIISNYYLDENHEFCFVVKLRLPRRMSLAEVLKQAKLNPVAVLESFFSFLNLEIPFPLTTCLAISIKYEGYIAKAGEHQKKLQRLDSMSIDWRKLIKSENISFECKSRIEKIKPSSFGQLKLIEGIRPATLAAVAGKTF